MEARGGASGWLTRYVWLELYSGVAALLLFMILLLSGISYMCVLQVPLWYAPQVLVPHFTVSTTFFLGQGPHRPEQLLSVRHRVYSVISLLGSLAGIAVGCVFIGLKLAFFFSSSPAECGELCNNGAVFATLIVTCAALLLVYVLNASTILYSWYRTARQATTRKR
jgi:hypothetical protein